MLASPLLRVSLAAALAVSAGAAQAASISVSLPDYDGPAAPGGYPNDLGVIGTFIYSLPAGSTILSATFSGTWGTAAFPSSTAGFDVEIEGQTLTVCVLGDPCWNGTGNLVPFALPLGPSTFAGLMDGAADLTVIQTSDFVVRLGTPTLEIVYAPVPEPGTWALMALGAVGLAGWMRRRAA